jgi:hypothetical protein
MSRRTLLLALVVLLAVLSTPWVRLNWGCRRYWRFFYGSGGGQNH